MHKVAVGILGASGYAGREIAGLVLRHPSLELAFATANERRGEQTRIAGREVTFVATDDAPLDRAALVFSALPHGHSRAWVERILAAGSKAVDLSADLRPGNFHGPLVGVLADDDVPYGLTEVTRERVRSARAVANPGCYPTAILLGLLPLLERGLVADEGTITINAASGVTGAGFTPRHDLLYAEVAEDFRPYAVGNVHRHLPEMRSLLSAAGTNADLIFTPHLLPVARGIIATMTVPLAEKIANPLTMWRERFAGEPFVEVVDQIPTLRDVVHRNVVRITVTPVEHVRRPTLLVISAIDNLMKGAAGQALQNGNLLLGIEETMGLPS